MADKILYGVKWNGHMSAIKIEIEMVRRGGQWAGRGGRIIGNGMLFHYKRLQQLLWPKEKVWHAWNDLQLDMYLAHRTICVIGPASSGKTNSAATDVLTDYYCWPECTTVIVCSTTKERLEDRVFGEIKKYHKLAKQRNEWLPGNLIEGRLRIVSDSRTESIDGRDFRNGIIGVPCKRGGDYVGLGDFIGIKNKRVRMVADELQLLPSAFIMAISNLDKNEDLKVIGLGNPKETTDALGAMGEPAYELGGWDGGIDQTPKTKTWKTRRPDGVCVQLVGSDSPNLDGRLGIPLITQAAIDRDIAQYGKDSLQFTMMNQGMMPRGQGSRRVITRQLCMKNYALDDPEWATSDRVKIGFLDAAYRGVGGDRCVFGEIQFGIEAGSSASTTSFLPNIVNQHVDTPRNRNILALIDTIVVPINVKIDVESEDQIVAFVKTQCTTRGILPENFFFDSGMRTSLVSAFARDWSPKTNPIDCGGSPSDRMVSDQIQTPCNKYYSKFITELWFSVRYVIEGGQFRGMKDGVMQEGCQREWTMVGGNRIEVEPKWKMKEKCLVAGTMVMTPIGEVPIESLRAGDLVNTPMGITPIFSVHENESSELMQVDLPNGRSLTGTGDHKVFTWNRGWTSIDELGLCSILESVNGLALWNIANRSCIKTTYTTFKQLVDTISAAGTKTIPSRSELCTGLFGQTIMARFQMVSMSIIRTVTGEITASSILSWLIRNLTLATTFVTAGGIQSSAGERYPEYQTSLPSLSFGISHQKVEPSTGSRVRTTGQSGSRNQRNVMSAEKIFRHCGAAQKPAQRNAPTSGLLASILTDFRYASSAAKSLWRAAIHSRCIVASPARPLPCTKSERVFDLTLLEHNAYYANGVLVANCGKSPDLFDALAVGVEGARQRGFRINNDVAIEPESDRPDWHSKIKEKARLQWAFGVLDYNA